MAHGIPKCPEEAWTKMSQTKVGTFIACARRGLLDHIVPEDYPLNPFAAHGIALHGLFQRFFTRHPSTMRFPYLERKALMGAWFGQWTGALEGRHGFGGMSVKHHPPQTVAWNGDPEFPKRLMERGMGICSTFYDRYHELRHDGHYRRVEAGFRFPGPEKIRLTGIIDRMDHDGDGAIILDYKSGRYPDHLIKSGLQLTYYQYAYECYFRRQQYWRVPLKGLQIYDYKSGTVQEAPIRPPAEFGELHELLIEVSLYIELTLTGVRPRNWRRLLFPHFPNAQEDIQRGEMSPHLPPMDHCVFCRHVAACEAWKAGTEPTARELFARYWKLHSLVGTSTAKPAIVSAAHQQGTKRMRDLLAANSVEQLKLDF